jgi:hypothetical protein
LNYSNSLGAPNKSGTVALADVGLIQDDILSVKELWTGESIDASKGIRYSIPPRDARIYRIARKPVTGIENLDENLSDLTLTKTASGYLLYSHTPIDHVKVYSLQGQQLQNFPVRDYCCQLYLPDNHGVFIVRVEYENDVSENIKISR